MKTTIGKLERIVGPRFVLHSPEDLAVYSYDGTFESHKPDLVVLPGSTDEVSRVVQLAAAERIPIVPRGMASGLAAASVPFSGGLVICLTRMDKVIEIDLLNATVKVQAGMITAELQKMVEDQDFFYPPDPSSIRHSTIGGNIACNAGGPRCLKYGVTGDYVLGMTVVLADGQILETGRKVLKDVAGYNLKTLFTGSEGTLGIITEALLKLIAKPKFTRTVLVAFATIDQASKTVNAILSQGILPATIELMDKTAIECVEEAFHLGLSTEPDAFLLIETDGQNEATVTHEIQSVVALCTDNGATQISQAEDEAERNALWAARRSMAPALARRAPNKLGEDITVPRSAIPEAIAGLRAISKKHGLPIVVFGHAGDGNLHPNILFDKRDPEQWRKVEEIVREEFRLALELGGTLSGEHGIGTLKRPFLQEALGETSIDLQKRLKQAMDPMNILNPGKVLPD